jgi:hypothetical protein
VNSDQTDFCLKGRFILKNNSSNNPGAGLVKACGPKSRVRNNSRQMLMILTLMVMVGLNLFNLGCRNEMCEMVGPEVGGAVNLNPYIKVKIVEKT